MIYWGFNNLSFYRFIKKKFIYKDFLKGSIIRKVDQKFLLHQIFIYDFLAFTHFFVTLSYKPLFFQNKNDLIEVNERSPGTQFLQNLVFLGLFGQNDETNIILHVY